MMEALFLTVLNMSITASWLVLAVIVLRFFLGKAPRAIRIVMWAMVGIRLVCPVSFESVLSLIPSVETIPADISSLNMPAIQSGIPVLDDAVNSMISETLAPAFAENASAGGFVNPMQVLAFAASAIWIAGMMAMLLYTVFSAFRIHRKVREAALLKENIWLCDHIAAPFIFGVIRPRIYLPSAMSEQDMACVVAHEKTHLKRHDHWWKPLGYLLLAVHWFNPVLWIAYILFCRDIELACDEAVIKALGLEIKKPYSEALINCSVPRKTIAACPLAFGEAGVKERIRAVLNYKRPAFWLITVAVAACIVLAAAFLTNPKPLNASDTDKAGGTGKPDSIYEMGNIGQQAFDAYDEFGLTMEIEFQSATEFAVYFRHNPYGGIITGTLTTSPEYEIRGIYNGETISFGDYMRVLGKEYEEAAFGWDAVIYTIESGGSLTLEENLQVTYGALPVGEYVMCKKVNLTTESGERITKIYSAKFAVID